VPLRLPSGQTAILRAELFGALAGVLDDLSVPEGLSDAAATARDGAVFARLVEAFDRGQIDLPDEEARARIESLAENHDEDAGYEQTTAIHDAHHALLDVLGGAAGGRAR
jgi:hypothetical protein